jgi:PhzF family phenazine biosynthesis protein
MAEVLRYAAFTLNGEGGNPAGVVLEADDLDEEQMQRIAAEVDYSETAFLTARADEPNVYDVLYFSPQQEVPFCGHATIAAAVALAEREPVAEMIFHTPAGLVTVITEETREGTMAELTSISPRISEPPDGLVERCLATLGWSADDLDPDYPPRLANAGAEHLVLVTRTHRRLVDLDYDFDALAAIMREHEIVTLQLIWPKSRKRYFSRNPFAGGGVVEDPATGAAAAAFGGYLRELGKIGHTAHFTIRQGGEIGRPSLIEVSVIEGEPGVRVRGFASSIDA